MTKVVRHMVGLRADVAAATRSSPSPADALAGMLSLLKIPEERHLSVHRVLAGSRSTKSIVVLTFHCLSTV